MGKFDANTFSKGRIVGPSISFTFCDDQTFTIELADYPASDNACHFDVFKEQLKKCFQSLSLCIRVWSIHR